MDVMLYKCACACAKHIFGYMKTTGDIITQNMAITGTDGIYYNWNVQETSQKLHQILLTKDTW